MVFTDPPKWFNLNTSGNRKNFMIIVVFRNVDVDVAITGPACPRSGHGSAGNGVDDRYLNQTKRRVFCGFPADPVSLSTPLGISVWLGDFNTQVLKF